MTTKTQSSVNNCPKHSDVKRRIFLAAAAGLSAGLTQAEPTVRTKIRSLLAEGSETIDTVIGTQPLIVPTKAGRRFGDLATGSDLCLKEIRKP